MLSFKSSFVVVQDLKSSWLSTVFTKGIQIKGTRYNIIKGLYCLLYKHNDLLK